MVSQALLASATIQESGKAEVWQCIQNQLLYNIKIGEIYEIPGKA